jgi:hypothetical protein
MLKTLTTPVTRGVQPIVPYLSSTSGRVTAALIAAGLLVVTVVSTATTSAQEPLLSTPALSLATSFRFLVDELGHPLIAMLYASASLPSMADIGAAALDRLADLLAWIP